MFPVCQCTEMSHAELKQQVSMIRKRYPRRENITNLESELIIPLEEVQIHSLLKQLNWHSEHGCVVCLPAIDYYAYISGLTVLSTEDKLKTEHSTEHRPLETADLHLKVELAREQEHHQGSTSIRSNTYHHRLPVLLRVIWRHDFVPIGKRQRCLPK